MYHEFLKQNAVGIGILIIGIITVSFIIATYTRKSSFGNTAASEYQASLKGYPFN